MKRLLLVAIGAVLLALPASAAGAQYSPMFITVDPTVVPVGGSIVVTAGYFEPGSDVQIRVQSDPVVLGSLVAAPDGTVTGRFDLPPSVQVGSHVVFAKGPRLGTLVATEVSASITVIAADVGAAGLVPTSAAVTTTSGALPVTGSDPTPLVVAAALLITLGGLLALRRRAVRRS